ALAMLGADEAKASPSDSRIENRKSKLAQLPPRAKLLIFIALPGGLRHVDTFAHTPELAHNHAKPVQAPPLHCTLKGTRGTVVTRSCRRRIRALSSAERTCRLPTSVRPSRSLDQIRLRPMIYSRR